MYCVNYSDEGRHSDHVKVNRLVDARMVLLETVYALDRYGSHTSGASVWVTRCDDAKCDGLHDQPDKIYSIGKRGGVVTERG